MLESSSIPWVSLNDNQIPVWMQSSCCSRQLLLLPVAISFTFALPACVQLYLSLSLTLTRLFARVIVVKLFGD